MIASICSVAMGDINTSYYRTYKVYMYTKFGRYGLSVWVLFVLSNHGYIAHGLKGKIRQKPCVKDCCCLKQFMYSVYAYRDSQRLKSLQLMMSLK